MRKFPLAVVLCLIAGTAMASTPTLFGGGSGPPNVVPSGRDVCWSEPADLNGLIASSEQILALGLESEVANDFVPTDGVSQVTFWGGYYNSSTPCVSGITTPAFNLKFYRDGGCVPASTTPDVAWIVATDFQETSVGCQSGAYPMFRWDVYASFSVVPGNLYWFGGQLLDHAFPPQAGRLAAATVTGCDTVFRSVYFGYPDWTPAIDVFGVSFDASQEFVCDGIGAGACCWPDGSCTYESPISCEYGDYQGVNTYCDPNPCVPYTAGACCMSWGCVVVRQDQCTAHGGRYLGDDTTCDGDPCATPTKITTWGQIKGSYR